MEPLLCGLLSREVSSIEFLLTPKFKKLLAAVARVPISVISNIQGTLDWIYIDSLRRIRSI